MQQPPTPYPQYPQQQWNPQQPPNPPQQYQQRPPATTNTRKRDNGDAICWLLLLWPVGLYMMWKYATWSLAIKIVITSLCAVFMMIWLLHVYG